MTRPDGMALDIDWTRCDGHGLCHVLLPDAVGLDEWGFPTVSSAPIGSASVPAVRAAVAACPSLALRLSRPPNSPTTR